MARSENNETSYREVSSFKKISPACGRARAQDTRHRTLQRDTTLQKDSPPAARAKTPSRIKTWNPAYQPSDLLEPPLKSMACPLLQILTFRLIDQPSSPDSHCLEYEQIHNHPTGADQYYYSTTTIHSLLFMREAHSIHHIHVPVHRYVSQLLTS
jgi:hypothetical protein